MIFLVTPAKMLPTRVNPGNVLISHKQFICQHRISYFMEEAQPGFKAKGLLAGPKSSRPAEAGG
jgi:hypothetical protein